jgi:glycerophosphoryl diester phosphodiesterase
VIISSFSKGLLYKVGRMAPHLKRSLLVLPKAFFFLDILFFANILAVWGINPHTSLLNKWLMGYCRARGLNVFVWTANNVDDILKAEKLRVDALITDDPLLAAEVLREKGKMI